MLGGRERAAGAGEGAGDGRERSGAGAGAVSRLVGSGLVGSCLVGSCLLGSCRAAVSTAAGAGEREEGAGEEGGHGLDRIARGGGKPDESDLGTAAGAEDEAGRVASFSWGAGISTFGAAVSNLTGTGPAPGGRVGKALLPTCGFTAFIASTPTDTSAVIEGLAFGLGAPGTLFWAGLGNALCASHGLTAFMALTPADTSVVIDGLAFGLGAGLGNALCPAPGFTALRALIPKESAAPLLRKELLSGDGG